MRFTNPNPIYILYYYAILLCVLWDAKTSQRGKRNVRTLPLDRILVLNIHEISSSFILVEEILSLSLFLFAFSSSSSQDSILFIPTLNTSFSQVSPETIQVYFYELRLNFFLIPRILVFSEDFTMKLSEESFQDHHYHYGEEASVNFSVTRYKPPNNDNFINFYPRIRPRQEIFGYEYSRTSFESVFITQCLFVVAAANSFTILICRRTQSRYVSQ